jgi:hypothetical protein
MLQVQYSYSAEFSDSQAYTKEPSGENYGVVRFVVRWFVDVALSAPLWRLGLS